MYAGFIEEGDNENEQVGSQSYISSSQGLEFQEKWIAQPYPLWVPSWASSTNLRQLSDKKIVLLSEENFCISILHWIWKFEKSIIW